MLQALGLKSGGTLRQRAERLFLTRNTTLEKLDRKHFAKGAAPVAAADPQRAAAARQASKEAALAETKVRTKVWAGDGGPGSGSRFCLFWEVLLAGPRCGFGLWGIGVSKEGLGFIYRPAGLGTGKELNSRLSGQSFCTAAHEGISEHIVKGCSGGLFGLASSSGRSLKGGLKGVQGCYLGLRCDQRCDLRMPGSVCAELETGPLLYMSCSCLLRLLLWCRSRRCAQTWARWWLTPRPMSRRSRCACVLFFRSVEASG